MKRGIAIALVAVSVLLGGNPAVGESSEGPTPTDPKPRVIELGAGQAVVFALHCGPSDKPDKPEAIGVQVHKDQVVPVPSVAATEGHAAIPAGLTVATGYITADGKGVLLAGHVLRDDGSCDDVGEMGGKGALPNELRRVRLAAGRSAVYARDPRSGANRPLLAGIIKDTQIEEVAATPASPGQPAKPEGIAICTGWITQDQQVLLERSIHRQDGSEEHSAELAGAKLPAPPCVVQLVAGRVAVFVPDPRSSTKAPLYKGIYEAGQVSKLDGGQLAVDVYYHTTSGSLVRIRRIYPDNKSVQVEVTDGGKPVLPLPAKISLAGARSLLVEPGEGGPRVTMTGGRYLEYEFPVHGQYWFVPPR